jgi:hypothetical protein
MRPRRTITFSTHTPIRVNALEAYMPFVVETSPIGPAYAVTMAPTATLNGLDDEDTRRGIVCPLCFVEQGLTGVCDSH